MNHSGTATTFSTMAPIRSSKNLSSSATAKLVPGCGFDCAFFDVAVSQAEQALERFTTLLPDHTSPASATGGEWTRQIHTFNQNGKPACNLTKLPKQDNASLVF